jgi:hypothetical protein
LIAWLAPCRPHGLAQRAQWVRSIRWCGGSAVAPIRQAWQDDAAAVAAIREATGRPNMRSVPGQSGITTRSVPRVSKHSLERV